MTAALTREVPAVGPLRTGRLPTVAERTLDSGLRVLAVRRPGVPLVELRLRVPFALSGASGRGGSGRDVARADLLTESMLTGTSTHSRVELAGAVQLLGGSLGASADADLLYISGSSLAPQLPTLLGLLAEALTDARYPAHEVATERERLIQQLEVAWSQPTTRGREALLHRLFGNHPYGRELPLSADIARVRPAALQQLHAERVLPLGAVLVLVGDLRPARVFEQAEQALRAWTGGGAAGEVAAPAPHRPRPVLLVDRPGAVQTTIRMGGPAPTRQAGDYAAAKLANLVFGGYFSSRLVANIRESKGYTYSPRSGIEHAAAASTVTIAADVATNVTAPALVEIGYELGRMATLPVEASELESARQFAIGSLALSTATAPGLASTLASLVSAGLDITFLRDHPKALAAVTAEQVQAAAHRYLAPAALSTVLLGDAQRIRDQVAALGSVETSS